MRLALESLDRVWAGWAPPTELTVSEFADRELFVTSGPREGTRWRTDFAPYQREIMNAFKTEEFVIVMGSSQWGKTACAVNVVCYFMAHDPCSILIVEPTVDPMAKDFAKNRLDPVIKASPSLEAIVDKKRAKDSSNTTLLKTYRGGFVALAGSNSAASLAARPVRVLIMDEVDRYERQLKGEGDTLSVAIKRTTTFRSRRRVGMFSTPTVVGAPIHEWFLRGDQRRYYVPCPHCTEFHAYEWKHVTWKDNDPSTAHLVCPHCGGLIDEAQRVVALQWGEWRPEHPERDDKHIVSFHLWEGYSPLSSLAEIVRGFLRARDASKAGDKASMHTWQNTTLGEPVEPDLGEGVEPLGLLLRREEYGPEIDLPSGVCTLTMGVDTQDDRLELVVVGWGLGEESWIIDKQVLPGDTSRSEPWAELDRCLAYEYRHASGVRIPIRAAAIDIGGHRTDIVYHYAALWAARRVYAVMGRDGDRPVVTSPAPRRYGQGERKVALYTIGTDAAKALLMSRLQLTEPGPGYIHLPMAGWCDEEFVLQLTSERLKATFERGEKKEKWKKVRPRNEALDCYVYAMGAFFQQQPDRKRRQDWVAKLADGLRDGPHDPPPAPPTKREGWIQPRRPGGWLKGNR